MDVPSSPVPQTRWRLRRIDRFYLDLGLVKVSFGTERRCRTAETPQGMFDIVGDEVAQRNGSVTGKAQVKACSIPYIKKGFAVVVGHRELWVSRPRWTFRRAGRVLLVEENDVVAFTARPVIGGSEVWAGDRLVAFALGAWLFVSPDAPADDVALLLVLHQNHVLEADTLWYFVSLP